MTLNLIVASFGQFRTIKAFSSPHSTTSSIFHSLIITRLSLLSPPPLLLLSLLVLLLLLLLLFSSSSSSPSSSLFLHCSVRSLTASGPGVTITLFTTNKCAGGVPLLSGSNHLTDTTCSPLFSLLFCFLGTITFAIAFFGADGVSPRCNICRFKFLNIDALCNSFSTNRCDFNNSPSFMISDGKSSIVILFSSNLPAYCGNLNAYFTHSFTSRAVATFSFVSTNLVSSTFEIVSSSSDCLSICLIVSSDADSISSRSSNSIPPIACATYFFNSSASNCPSLSKSIFEKNVRNARTFRVFAPPINDD